MSFLFSRRRGAGNRNIIDRMNDDIVVAVRAPAFYLAGGVPDTFQGRFELLVLHAALVMRRLKALPDPGAQVAQDLVDTIFRNLDPALRELGVGDMAVPKRMKRLAEAFLGRSVAYARALDSDEPAQLATALARNVHDGARSADDLAAYARAAAAALDGCDLDRMLREAPPFPDPAAFMAEDMPR